MKPQTVKELRHCMGMTQKAFSEYFEISYRTLQRWEANPELMPSYVFHLMLYKYENELAKGNLVAH